jgi:hypothetical protein
MKIEDGFEYSDICEIKNELNLYDLGNLNDINKENNLYKYI